MPFPSAGCQTCKIRRIKGAVVDPPLQCDETRPTCRRCTKSRRICLETSDAKQACFPIHLENCYASGKIKRPRGPRSSLTILRPHFDLHARALAYYLEYHLQTLTDVPSVSEGLAECVSAWKVSGRTCPMVDLALSSMALAVYSRTQQHPTAAGEASSRYYRLLQVAQERLAHVEIQALDERNVDACLLAIYLMGRYENVMHCPGHPNAMNSFMSLQSWSHHDGAMAILKVWNDNLSHDAATSIIKQSRRGLIRSSLLRNLPLPDWMLEGDHFGEHDRELDYDRILVRIVNLHYAFARLHQKNDPRIVRTEELNIQAGDLDKELQDWAGQLPSTYSYQRHILTESDPWPRKDFYSPTVYSYSGPGYAAVWIQYFAARMLINSTRLRILELTLPNPSTDFVYEEQRLESITHLNSMTDRLASTIPFCLERFKPDSRNAPISQTITLSTNEEVKPYLASLAVWPLVIASSLGGIDVRQQLWFRSELAGIGKIIGDGVLAGVETKQWAIL
ncbi:MAG: hypothetical protein M1818_007367 [Claussenomyces sp. TS43310]|nr:MAG: hypothetical protein M1818_007367 [Claussenomyces sp. TS43310]